MLGIETLCFGTARSLQSLNGRRDFGTHMASNTVPEQATPYTQPLHYNGAVTSSTRSATQTHKSTRAVPEALHAFTTCESEGIKTALAEAHAFTVHSTRSQQRHKHLKGHRYSAMRGTRTHLGLTESQQRHTNSQRISTVLRGGSGIHMAPAWY